MNITFFTGWQGRLSPRGNIVDRGGAEVDNAFQGVTIYHVIRKECNIYFIIPNVPIQLQFYVFQLLYNKNVIFIL